MGNLVLTDCLRGGMLRCIPLLTTMDVLRYEIESDFLLLQSNGDRCDERKQF